MTKEEFLKTLKDNSERIKEAAELCIESRSVNSLNKTFSEIGFEDSYPLTVYILYCMSGKSSFRLHREELIAGTYYQYKFYLWQSHLVTYWTATDEGNSRTAQMKSAVDEFLGEECKFLREEFIRIISDFYDEVIEDD